MTGWPCQYCGFNCYWQGHPVNSEFRTTVDMVTLSITVETAVLTGSPCQYCINKHCWQGHPVNSHLPCITDRVTLSTVYQNMLLNNNQSGAKKCNQSEPVLHRFYPVSSGRDYNIDRVTLSAVGGNWCLIDMVTMSAVAVVSYWQGHPVSSGWWCIIDRVTQWVVMSYWQGHPVSTGGWCLIDHVDRSGGWCLIDRVTLSAVGVHVIGY